MPAWGLETGTNGRTVKMWEAGSGSRFVKMRKIGTNGRTVKMWETGSVSRLANMLKAGLIGRAIGSAISCTYEDAESADHMSPTAHIKTAGSDPAPAVHCSIIAFQALKPDKIQRLPKAADCQQAASSCIWHILRRCRRRGPSSPLRGRRKGWPGTVRL